MIVITQDSSIKHTKRSYLWIWNKRGNFRVWKTFLDYCTEMVSCCHREVMFTQESAFSYSCKNICGRVLSTSKIIYWGFCKHFFSPLLVSDWVTISHKITYTTMATWYIFGAYFTVKNKTLLTWSLWSRLYSSLNFLEKAKLCYISFYSGKMSWTLFLLLGSQACRPSLWDFPLKRRKRC